MTFLVLGAVLAALSLLTMWARARLPRSPLRSVDEFRSSMRALAPRRNDRT